MQLDELLVKVRQMGELEAPAPVSPSAKAEAHDQARALGIVLVADDEESVKPRHQRPHPMA